MNSHSRPPCSLLLLLLAPAIFFFSVFTLPPPCSAAGASPPHPRALVVPITKNPAANVYTAPFTDGGDSFLLDIGGPLLWSAACSAAHPVVPCKSKTCAAARTFLSPLCPASLKRRRRPPCACRSGAVNPLARTCAAADLTVSNATVSATDGKNPAGPIAVPLASLCAPRTTLKSLPAGVAGVAGLARSGLALPAQLASKLSFRRQFAICLPSGGSPGVAFFGNGPFYLLPPPGIDVTARLSYTKLKKNKMSPGYFLPLRGIAVNGRMVQFLARVLEFDSLGHGGAALSTVAPYTVLHSHIYRRFLKAYAAATALIPRARKVAPFDLCLNSSALGSTRVGYGVPPVDLMLHGGRNWTILGANSFKQVDADTACLAFVDGGARAERAVVVGAFQMENAFLLVDVAKSKLGFVSSLLGGMTTCSNFNFTVV